MDLYKYNTSDFLNEEINFSDTLDYFTTSVLSNPLTDADITFAYEENVFSVESENVVLYFYSDISFVCDLSEIEGIEGQPYFESLNLFSRLNNEIDKLFFNNETTELLDLGGTFINTQITTKTISYGMSITCIVLFFIGIIGFFKKIFQLIGGR